MRRIRGDIQRYVGCDFDSRWHRELRRRSNDLTGLGTGTVTGERDLDALLTSMKPEILDGIFVFCTLAPNASIPASIRPMLTFREREGTTLVIPHEEAERAGLRHEFPSRLITLTVHSALDAVGFLAAITARLAEAGISVNAVSAFHHDHLFVPVDRADEAMAVLQRMSKGEHP